MEILKLLILLVQMGTAPSFPDGDASVQQPLANKITIECKDENSAPDVLHTLQNNPVFKNTSPSVFTKENVKNSYIFLTQIDSSYLFSEDCDYSLLKFLRYETNAGNLSYSIFDSTDDIAKGESYRKIIWNDGITVKLFEDNNIYTTNFNSYTEYWKCPEKKDYAPKYPFIKPVKTELRKNLTKKQQGSAYDVLTNPIFLLSIVPADVKANTFISNLGGKSVKTSLNTSTGNIIEGRAIELNGDNVIDAFWYVDVVDSRVAEWFVRLYLNIGGEWIPIWYTYFKEL